MNESLDHYLALPYRVVIEPDEEGEGFNATIQELKGCVAYGDTVMEAFETVHEIKRTWLEMALEKGWRIPEPQYPDAKQYSGKFRLRLPRYLHGQLAELAKREATSLNQLVVALLSQGVQRLRYTHSRSAFSVIENMVLKLAGSAQGFSSGEDDQSEFHDLFPGGAQVTAFDCTDQMAKGAE